MNRQVHTTFCDDIRHEVGGKFSYIGIYSDKMLVSPVPSVLPKLCLAMSVITPLISPFRRLAIRVLKDDEELARRDFSESELLTFDKVLANLTEAERQDRVQVIRAIFVFSPFQIAAPCTLKVRVDTEEKDELRGIGLRIEQAPPQLLEQQSR